MAAVTFQTSLSVGQDGNTDAESVDPFRYMLDSISGSALTPNPLTQSGTALADVKSGAIDMALMSATSPLSTGDGDHLNFTHEFGMEVAEYWGWWLEAKLYGTLANFPRQDVANFLLNDMKAKYNAHIASVAHHLNADAANVVAAADATDLATSITLVNAIKAAYNLHRVEAVGPVHATHPPSDTVNVVTVANATDLATVITLAEDIDIQYKAHITNNLGTTHHTIPDTVNMLVKGGETLFQVLLDSDLNQLVQIPLVLRSSESGGWFPESMTLKKFLDGQFSDGTQIKYRAFGTHADAMIKIFPNVTTVQTGAGFTDLGAIFADVFNSGEFNEPYGDASPHNPAAGLFPNWPLSGGSIVDAMGGRPHYYIGSYHTPFRHRTLLVNKTFWLARSPAEQDMIVCAARHCAMQNLAHSYQGGDAIIKAWQDMGVVIHKSLPRDVLDRFRTGLGDAQEDIGPGYGAHAGTPDPDYEILLASQRDFMKQNAVRWASLPDRAWRVARTDYETVLKPNA
jgi:hypothetical protein